MRQHRREGAYLTMQTARATCSLVLARRVARGAQAARPAFQLPCQFAGASAHAASFSSAVRSRTCRRLLHVTRASDAAAADAPAPAAAGEGAIYDSLDIRVGKIIKAWKHPEAEKLFVEEVDVGEPEPRQICSGLVGYVPEEELQGRNVVVLCNLKARNMRGVKSYGMLMAASDKAHENVELLHVPEGAAIGERIKFGTAPQTPADTENKVQKKKIWEAVQPELRTDGSGVAFYKDLQMMTSAGPVTVKRIMNGNIS